MSLSCLLPMSSRFPAQLTHRTCASETGINGVSDPLWAGWIVTTTRRSPNPFIDRSMKFLLLALCPSSLGAPRFCMLASFFPFLFFSLAPHWPVACAGFCHSSALVISRYGPCHLPVINVVTYACWPSGQADRSGSQTEQRMPTEKTSATRNVSGMITIFWWLRFEKLVRPWRIVF